MIRGSVIARVGKQSVPSFGRRVWRLPDKRPRCWRAERTRRRAKASGDPDPGPGPRSRGDVLEGRFALAEFTKSIFRRHRVKVTDKMSTADNFPALDLRSEEHTSELQSLMRISYAVFCLKKKNNKR